MRRTRKVKPSQVAGGYEVRFRPPGVVLSERELLLPIVHTSRSELAAAAKALNGSSFHVKVVDATPQSIPGGYVVMAKLKALKPGHDDQSIATRFKEGGKVTGQILGEIAGLQVTANLQRAKRKGKDRVWFQIRQPGLKAWRVSETLSYARALDVQFERE